MQVTALPKSTTGITDEQCQGKQDAWNEGRRELTTMQVAKLFSAGRSSKEIARNDSKGAIIVSAAKQSPAPLHGIAAPRPVGARNDKSAWWWPQETAVKIWRRDLQMPVSSLVLGREIAAPFYRRARNDKWEPSEIAAPRYVGARNDSTDYLCLRSILHREGAGRSWAMNNTSNLPEVECK
jgi:hypothetical protein